ncbi:MAG: hypothetical protein ABIF71_16115 [Planctomycetota bacterium]
MRKVKIGSVTVSGVCIGGNPFSGFSHQTDARTKAMLAYYTPEGIKDALHKAEAAGINTVFARTDDHIFNLMRDYWKAGGKLQWFARVCSAEDDPEGWRTWMKKAADLGASGAYMHGGQTEFWFANEKFDVLNEAVALMRTCKLGAAGLAGHNPFAHAWIRDNLEVDFQMCSYYNPTDRTASPHHQSVGEKWRDTDREVMLALIATIKRPVVHYKVFAGGNLPVVEGFERMGRTMKATDVACIGMFLGDDPDMAAKDVALFEKHVDKAKPAGRSGRKG